jgi:hypothetical protein
VANARTAELPEGDCAVAYKAFKATFAPGTVAERMDFEKDFRNYVLKNAKTKKIVQLLLIFLGKLEYNKIWAFKFESYASMKEFMPIMNGEIVLPNTDQEEKTPEELKAWKTNANQNVNLLSGMNTKGVGFSIVANARTAELPEGLCSGIQGFQGNVCSRHSRRRRGL